MRFSTKDRYALRLMVELAGHAPEEFVSLKAVSDSQGISVKYLEQIVPPLARAGLLASGRGSQGGYRRTRPAAAVTAGDVLRAVEGDLAPVPCLEEDAGDCPRRSGCRTLAFWEGLGAVLEQYADGVTLAQLCGAPGGGKEDA